MRPSENWIAANVKYPDESYEPDDKKNPPIDKSAVDKPAFDNPAFDTSAYNNNSAVDPTQL